MGKEEEGKTETTAQTSEVEVLLAKEREKAQSAFAEATDYKKKLEEYQKYGDPETLFAKQQELDNLKKEKAKTSPEDLEALIDEKVGTVRSEAQKAIDEERAKNKQLSTQLHEIQVVNTAWDKIGAEFAPDAGKLLKNILREKLTRTEEGVLAVKGKDGKPEYKDGVTLRTVTDLAEDLKAEYPSLVADKSISGTMKTNGITRTDSGEKTLDFNALKDLPASEIRKKSREMADNELKNKG